MSFFIPTNSRARLQNQNQPVIIKKSVSGMVQHEQKFRPPELSGSYVTQNFQKVIEIRPYVPIAMNKNYMDSNKKMQQYFPAQSMKGSTITTTNPSLKNHREYFKNPEMRVIKPLKSKRFSVQESTINKPIESPKKKNQIFESLYWEQIKKKKITQNFTRKLAMSCRVNDYRYMGLCKCEEPCTWAKKWIGWTKNPNNATLYKNLMLLPVKPAILIQIEKDVPRTQPHSFAFKEEDVQRMLKEILITYSKYDKATQYVQGMNMIASVLLYHIKNSEQSFWVLVDIMEQQELLQLYDNMKLYEKLEHHNNNVIKLLKYKVNDLYTRIEELEVNIRPALFGWYLSLLCNIVPLDHAHKVIDMFIDKGWVSIYKIILTFFIYIKEELLMQYEESEFLGKLSVTYHTESQNDIDWQDILQSSTKLNIQSLLLTK